MDSADLTSWSVVLGAATGQPVDREVFCQRYAPLIRSYLAARWRRPFDHDDVADATNDVFVECFKGGGALERVDPRRPGGFRAFLFGVIRNVALLSERRFARRRDKPAAPTDMDALAADEASLSKVFDRAWAATVVREAQALMRQRAPRTPASRHRFETLALRFERGLPPREIAAALGRPVEQIYETLREARREFRATLIEVMAVYHPMASEAELEKLCIELLSSLK